MKIQSDDGKPLFCLCRIKEYILTWQFVLLLNITIVISSFVLFNTVGMIILYAILSVIVLVISGGEIMDDAKSFNNFSFWALMLSFVIFLFFSPTKTASDTMIANEYIEVITENKECNKCDGKRINIDLKPPFDEVASIDLIDAKFTKKIVGFNEDNKFVFNITKTCHDYVWSTFDCSVKLSINHEFEEKELGNTELKNAIYPKKLEFSQQTK